MLSAIRKSDTKKVIGQLIEKNSNQDYYCDNCKEEMIHHKSKSGVRIGHFKHKSGSDCSNYKKMSIEHLQIQYQIFNYISKNYKTITSIELEKWLGNNSIRADVYIRTKKGTEIGIEVQSSSITHDEISRRTALYAKHNIYVLWLLPYDESRHVNDDEDDDYNFDQRIKLKSYEQFLYWSNMKALYYWDIAGKDKFIKLTLSNITVPQDDYYDEDGNLQIGGERVIKTFKSIDDFSELDFSDFRPKQFNEFEHKKIPERKIMITN